MSDYDGRVGNGDFSNFKDRYLPTRFSKERQPDPEKKRMRYLGKKGRELIKAVLEEKFKRDDIIEQAAAYFHVEPDEITNELMLVFAQVSKAINKQDSIAFDILMNRAYGKPKDVGPDEDVEAPAIVIQPVVTMQEAPPIAEEEPKEDGGLMPQ